MSPTGGYLGYLPTREAFAGEPTYETVISPIAAGESERLVNAAMALIQNDDTRLAVLPETTPYQG